MCGAGGGTQDQWPRCPASRLLVRPGLRVGGRQVDGDDDGDVCGGVGGDPQCLGRGVKLNTEIQRICVVS